MWDQTGQHAVEQIDVIGAESRSALQEQLADTARGIGAALGVVASNDFVESGDQRGRWCHAALLAGPASKTFLSRCQILVRYRMADDDKTADAARNSD